MANWLRPSACYLAAAFLDLISTEIALTRHGVWAEANPVIRFLYMLSPNYVLLFTIFQILFMAALSFVAEKKMQNHIQDLFAVIYFTAFFRFMFAVNNFIKLVML